MELWITLHGEAVHQLSTKGADAWNDPELTLKGRTEAELRRKICPLGELDMIVAGPSLRMLHTASLWSGDSGAARFVHPIAGARAHPFRFDFEIRDCDWPMDVERILTHFPEWLFPSDVPEHLWVQGVSTLPPLLFDQQARRFAAWCQTLQKKRVFIVTDAGTRQELRSFFMREGLAPGLGAIPLNGAGLDGISLSL